jgi:hypothetical protein
MPQFFLGGVFTSVRKRVVDTFSRSDRSDLGRATDGSLWQTIREGLSISNNRAAATNPSQYPMSTVDMPFSDVTIELTNVSPGGGAAIWVQSSEDWWVVTASEKLVNLPEQTRNESATYQYTARNSSSFSSGNFTVTNYQFTEGNYFTVTRYFYFFQNATGYNTAIATYNYRTNANYLYTISGSTAYKYAYFGAISGTAWAYRNWSYRTGGTYAYTASRTWTYSVAYTYSIKKLAEYTVLRQNASSFTSTTNIEGWTSFNPGWNYITFAPYTYVVVVPAREAVEEQVNIWQSIAGELTLVKNWAVSTVAAIRSLRVRLRNNEITVSPYSDENLVQQVGDNLVYTATGAEITTRFGITISPSDYEQGTTAATTISISENNT